MLVFNEVRCLVGGTRLGQQVTFVLIVTLITLLLILIEQQLMLSYTLASRSLACYPSVYTVDLIHWGEDPYSTVPPVWHH